MGFLKKTKENLNKLRGVEEEKTPKQIKDEVADIRKSCENLKNRIMALRFKDNSGNIPPEKMRHYVEVCSALAYTLDQSQTYALDTRDLDQTMMELPKKLQEAISNGKEKTADRIITALLYGVGKGHKMPVTDDEAYLKKELEDRKTRLKQYCAIVELSVKIDESEQAIEKLAHKFKSTAALYKEKKAALEAQRKENPYIFEKLQAIKSRHEAEDPEVLNLVVQMDEVTDLNKEIVQLKQEKTTHLAAIQGFDTTIRNEENMLMMSDVVLEDELVQKIEQDIVDFREKIADAWDQVFKLGDLNDQTSFALNAIFSSAGIINYVTGISMEYDDILREERRREEGMRLAQERAQEAELENEEEENEGGVLLENE